MGMSSPVIALSLPLPRTPTPNLKSTITGLWDALEEAIAIEPEIGFQTHYEKMKALNESVDTQSKLLDYATRINQLITPPIGDDDNGTDEGLSRERERRKNKIGKLSI